MLQLMLTGPVASFPLSDLLLTDPKDNVTLVPWQVNDASNVAGSPGELLSRRCVSLMKSALRPDMWPRAELKLQWFDKLLMTVVS